MRWLNGITDAMDMNLGKLQVMVRTERPGILQFLGSQKVGQDWVTEQYNNENNEKGVKETVPKWNQNWLFLATLTPRGFPDSSDGEESACNARDKVHPCVGKIAREGNGYQYSILAWRIP